MVQPLWKTVWKFLRKLKIKLPHAPAIPLLDVYLEKTINQRDTCTPMFTAALFTIAKTWKQPKCSSKDEWIKKRGEDGGRVRRGDHLPPTDTPEIHLHVELLL